MKTIGQLELISHLPGDCRERVAGNVGVAVKGRSGSPDGWGTIQGWEDYLEEPTFVGQSRWGQRCGLWRWGREQKV